MCVGNPERLRFFLSPFLSSIPLVKVPLSLLPRGFRCGLRTRTIDLRHITVYLAGGVYWHALFLSGPGHVFEVSAVQFRSMPWILEDM